MTKLQQLEAELYSRSYYEFFIASLKILEPSLKFENNWHIKYLCDELQIAIERVGRGENKEYDLVINVPPRSMKSTIVTIALNAWTWIKYPELRIISTSYSSSLSTEHCQKSRALIESIWYQELFSNRFHLLKDNNQKTNFENDKKGHRQISSVGTGTTGKGADIIIFDDLINTQLAGSENGRQLMKDYFFTTMYTRLNNQKTGLRIIVEQRLHENDLTGLIIQKKMKIKHICLPVIESDNIKPIELKSNYKKGLLFENRFDANLLEEFAKNIGSTEFATQYLQLPAPDTGLIIKEEWLKNKFIKSDLPENFIVNFMSDTAYGDRNQKGDYNATLAYFVYQECIYITSMYHNICEFPDYIREHKDYINANGYTSESRDYFEPKATGKTVVQTLSREGINAIESKPPTDSKEVRVRSITPILEAGRVKFLAGVDWERLIHECKTFPNGKHDDIVDCLVNIIIVELMGERKGNINDLNNKLEEMLQRYE